MEDLDSRYEDGMWFLWAGWGDFHVCSWEGVGAWHALAESSLAWFSLSAVTPQTPHITHCTDSWKCLTVNTDMTFMSNRVSSSLECIKGVVSPFPESNALLLFETTWPLPASSLCSKTSARDPFKAHLELFSSTCLMEKFGTKYSSSFLSFTAVHETADAGSGPWHIE